MVNWCNGMIGDNLKDHVSQWEQGHDLWNLCNEDGGIALSQITQ